MQGKISYIEIVRRLDEKKKKDKKNNERTTEPAPSTEDEIPPFNESACSLKTSQWVYWVIRLGRIRAFIEQFNDIQHRCVIMPISTRAANNLAIWGDRRYVSDAVKLMIGIGILRLESASFTFDSSEGNKCRTYRYYKDNAEQFIRFCEKNRIWPHSAESILNIDFEKITKLITFDITEVAFCHKKLWKPQGVSKREFEAFLTKCLHENYPQWEYYRKIAKEINETYYKNGIDRKLRIKFEPHFTWSDDEKYVRKIGIRATCSLDNTSRDDRHGILQERSFDKEKDVKSSVPRVTISLNKGAWLSDNVDLYKRIYDNCEQDEVFSDDKFPNEMREALKTLFMRAYFDGTDEEMVHHIWRDMEQEGISKKDVGEQMIRLRNAIYKTCGEKPRGSEIFLAESCVYLRAFQRLLAQGRKGWLLYDAFYCSSLDGESDEEFDATVEQYLKESFAEYLSISN